jgi:hypothetical protein
MERLIGNVLAVVAFVMFCLSIYDCYFMFDGIKSKTLIKPKIELVIENNKIDTLYVYEIKQQDK